MPEQTLIERAFQLVESGLVTDTTELRKRLKAEGYAESRIIMSLGGRHTGRQLRDLLDASRRCH